MSIDKLKIVAAVVTTVAGLVVRVLLARGGTGHC